MRKQAIFPQLFFWIVSLGFGLVTNAQCPKHQALFDKMDESMAQKDVSMMDEVYHADAKRHHSQGTTVGLDKIKEEAKSFYADVPDAKGENVEVFCNGDKIVSRWVGTGTPKGSPKKVTVSGITIMHVKDGKIAEEWEEMNSLALMMQMGYQLTPPSGGNED